MKITLNNSDIHAAIRGYLQNRNIVNASTELDINISVSRGTNAGAQADVSIIDTNSPIVDEIAQDAVESKESPFGDRLKGA